MKIFLWKIYAYRFFDAFKLVGVIFTLLFQHNGLNPFQISLLIGTWSATQLVLEVPLGVFADKYPRRNLLIIALLLLMVGYFFWLIGGFFFYALGFILWGIKNALTSGTLEAFVYDELKAFNQEHLYEKVNGKMEGAFYLGVMFSAVLGGIVAAFSFNLVIWASIATTILAVLILFTIRSVKAVQSTGESKYLVVLKEAIKEIHSNQFLVQLLSFICLVFAVYGAADEYWALIYQDLGLSVGVIGFLLAIAYGLYSLAGYTLHFFNSKRIVNIEYILIILSALLFIVVGIVKSITLIPLILIGIYLLRVANLKFDVKFQHAISANQRATISSLKSLLFEVVYLIFVLIFGFTSTKLGTISTLYILGGMLIFWVIIFGLTLKGRKSL